MVESSTTERIGRPNSEIEVSMKGTLRRGSCALALLAGLALPAAGCGSSSSSSNVASAATPGSSATSASSSTSSGGSAAPSNPKFAVVAAENFWGSIASQLAGNRATVQSIIVNPNTDPHSYQPTAEDQRTIATGKVEIVNGIGYDKWMEQALGSNPVSGQVVLNVGDLLSLKEGDNPHQWYSPTNVYKVINQIVADYDKVDPADSAYFAHQKQTFETTGLAQYNALRTEIRTKYSGVPIGYSESIFQPMGEDLGLKLLTPYSFTKAIAEGTEVTAQDKQTVDRQAQDRLIKVWVYNSQNATPDVQRVNELAGAAHIPITTVTETLSPASASFEQWQVAQLQNLMAALHKATGK